MKSSKRCGQAIEPMMVTLRPGSSILSDQTVLVVKVGGR